MPWRWEEIKKTYKHKKPSWFHRNIWRWFRGCRFRKDIYPNNWVEASYRICKTHKIWWQEGID